METVNIMEFVYNLIKRIDQQDAILIAVLVVFVLQYAWLVLVWIRMNDQDFDDKQTNEEIHVKEVNLPIYVKQVN